MTQPLEAIEPTLPAGAAPVACVDIGGTKVAVSLADARGLRRWLSEPTVKTGARDALATQVIRLVQQSCQAAGLKVDDLAAVGVACCGPFVLHEGLVELAAPNICGGLAGPARGLPNHWVTAVLEAPLRRVFPGVQVENDGIAALLAERRWGALRRHGQPLDHCAYVTWSTGIGMGLCVDGHVLRGKNGNAGHAGHLFVSDHDDGLCGCGNVGDVEGLVAGNAIPRRFGHLGYTDAAVLFVAAAAGDARAAAIVDELCRLLGRALYNLVVTLDLQRISLGGSVFWHQRGLLLPKLQAQINGRMAALTAGCDLVPAGLGLRTGDFGALALVAGEG